MIKKDLSFEDKLWQAADKLRSRGGIEASSYKNIVLGLIFLKYVSDSFEKHRSFLERAVASQGVTDEEGRDYYIPQPELREFAVEDKSQYAGHGIFYIPKKARWEYLLQNINSPELGKIIDEAMLAIEDENPRIKGILPKNFANSRVSYQVLGELIKLFSEIDFKKEEEDKDILGRVYEYFLGKFADSEGKRGGEFYTPRSIVKLLVEILEPFEGCRVFDPACGSGGMFVQSYEFLKLHKKNPSNISFAGQELIYNTWQLCQMNLALRGISADLIKVGDSFHDDKFFNERFDIVISNPPFNVSDWNADKISPNDPRVKYGIPPNSNANFMWIQHFLYHLSPDGIAGFVMANGALAVGGKEGEIRKKIIEDDLVDVIIACPPKLFYNVTLPVSLWFLTKNKANKRFKDRRGKTLFIDAREIYEPISRKQYTFTEEQIQKIADTVRAWRGERGEYKDILGFCKSATIKEIAENGYVLTPGRYVGVAPPPDDGIPFEEKFEKLKEELQKSFEENRKLEEKILENLKLIK